MHISIAKVIFISHPAIPKDDVQVAFVIVRQFTSHVRCRIEYYSHCIIQNIFVLLRKVSHVLSWPNNSGDLPVRCGQILIAV